MASMAYIEKINYWKTNRRDDVSIHCDPIHNNDHFTWLNNLVEQQYTNFINSGFRVDGFEDYSKVPFDTYINLAGRHYIKNTDINTKNDGLSKFFGGAEFTTEVEMIKRIRFYHRCKMYWNMIRISVKLLSLQKRAALRVNHPSAKRKRGEFEIVDDEQ